LSPRKRKPKRQRKPARRDDAYLLDRFSEKDLRQWKRQAELLREYRVKEYYYLEGLRAVHKEEIARALTSSPPPPLRVKGWTRIVDYKYSHEPLSAIGSLHVSGRFNVGRDVDPEAFPVFSALYVAEDYDTAYAEKFSAGRQASGKESLAGHELSLRTTGSFSAVRVKGVLHNAFDLRNARTLRTFASIVGKFELSSELKEMAEIVGNQGPYVARAPADFKKSFLTENWRFGPMQYDLPSNPQIFGRLLLDAGFDAVVYPSTKGAGDCVAVFIDNLVASESFLELADDAPSEVKMKRLDKDTAIESIRAANRVRSSLH
jgi:hypothetical protein